MTETKIDIRSGTLFPWHFQLIAALILIAGIVLLIGKPVVGSVLIVAAGFILTAASGTEIDTSKNMYREYTSFFFILKSGKWKQFKGAEKLFINSSKKSTQMHTAHTNHSSVFTDQEYNGYMKLTDGTKIHLLTSGKKEKLVATLNKAASFLQVPLQDNTVANS
jgi:hypothetical protein